MAITREVKEKAYSFTIAVFSFFVFFTLLYSFNKIIYSLAPDFHVFYYSATDVLRGIDFYNDRNLFTGFGYPPFTALLYVPFAFLPFQVSQAFFLLLSFLTALGSVFISLKLLSVRFSFRLFLLLLSLFLFSFPVKFTFGMGQSNLVAYFFLLVAIYFFTVKKEIGGNIFFVLAILLKPIFGFFLLYLLLEKKWKTLAVIIISLFSVFLISLRFFSVDTYRYYVTDLVPHLLNITGREVYYNQGITGFIARLIPRTFLLKPIATGISLFLLIGAIYFFRKYKSNAFLIFGILSTVLVLIDTLSWQHHFVFLLFPFIQLFIIFRKQKKYNLFFLLFISYLLVSANIKNPGSFSSFPTSLLLSHGFFGALILLCLQLKTVFLSKR